MDKAILNLAKLLIEHSVSLKPNEKILIEYQGTECIELVEKLVEETYKLNAIPFVKQTDASINRELLFGYTKEGIEQLAIHDVQQMEYVDAYISVKAVINSFENVDTQAEKRKLVSQYYDDTVHNKVRLSKKWCILRYPTASFAQAAKMSQQEFEKFFFDVCTLDYKQMEKDMQPLVKLMEKTDKVKITGKGTDLTFSIKDIPVIYCAGEFNIPDGEVFTAPVKDSVNGKITYTVSSTYEGFSYSDVCLEFENGKIVKATANDTDRINEIFDRDEGARYIGEFAIGCNPKILEPMDNILFDEKIGGSFHFTPGACYDDASNGNKSLIHWDLVCIQTKKYGGGEIYFDDVLIRKDGLFVLEELKALNF